MKLKIYRIKESYIEYLRTYDYKVAYNKNQKRPYIGIVLEVNNFKYFAPMSSPKEKHMKMKNSLDFIKIDNGKLGIININNMIPVGKNDIINININEKDGLSNKDKQYNELIIDQLKFINRDKNNIITKSNKLYDKVTNYNSFIKERCVNFKLLELKCIEYENNKNKEKSNTKKVEIRLVDRISEASERASEYNKAKDNKIKVQAIDRID